MADEDPPTGLANWRMIARDAKKTMAAADWGGKFLAVLLKNFTARTGLIPELDRLLLGQLVDQAVQ